MKKTMVAAAALASAAALTGASVTSAAPAHQAPAEGVFKWKLTELTDKSTHNGFIGTDAVRSRTSGKLVGYDTVTGRFDPSTGEAAIDVAVALKGGLVVAVLHSPGGPGPLTFTGDLLGGTNEWRCITGRVRGHAGRAPGVTFVTAHFRNVCM